MYKRQLYGTEAVFFAAILEMVNDVVIFTIGMMLIQMSAGAKLRFEPKLFLNPGLIGVIVGLLLFLLDIRLPEVIGGAVEMVGDATTPLTDVYKRQVRCMSDRSLQDRCFEGKPPENIAIYQHRNGQYADNRGKCGASAGRGGHHMRGLRFGGG